MAYPSYKDLQEVRKQLKDVGYERWVEHDLFSWQWWLLLAATILPWIGWMYLVKKPHRPHVFAFAMLIGITSSILDVIGADMLLWGYPTKLIFMVPPLFPADLTMIPVLFSLVYYYGKVWSRYIVYVIFLAIVFSYVFEPLFEIVDIYRMHHFPHWASLIGFVCVALIVRWVLDMILPKRD
ncbi:CBO0543 family protein [Ectobacillus funiculus]|uniref:CBO0543 family protein n=1 Tax=Ectobacillus funiculus TaxID=137993 RepID=UPI00101C8CF2|nr:CBO0543 family protein [Ectobacillus funiculus]